ncbi:hypothetical protein BGZ99_005349 [Dissophora globulifera]|uniref:Uncharacterized protein n=1 Tax=Dissophora globulifera TaxID=979702 RepID=A0A9P6UTT3_9FUNG|nr:hypothetical protein BGZ99_005349 [Dissophora globulifera]
MGSFHLNPQPPLPIKDESIYDNPYRTPSHTNTHAFIPPRVAGYEFMGGSQAGNMGLMMGRRISDGVPVTGKLHQSRVLLQHEYRILKRLQISNARFIPDATAPQPTASPNAGSNADSVKGESASEKENEQEPDVHQTVYETGCVETEKYFNRVVEDFIDLDQEDMSILILERLGPSLISNSHHRFMGQDVVNELHGSETQKKRDTGSPFPDARTFLIFALKAACILEALLQSNIAHLAICPTAWHWMPAETDVGPWSSSKSSSSYARNDENGSSSGTREPQRPPQIPQSMDINDTKLRLFDFTHSKILSHERARAPNNIVEWQIPGYLEYHLHFLAPEQTGRAETWMDQRTDIYGLGATLFSLLTMQYPNPGVDSVQILQGVLSKDLPPLCNYRPDMPPIIDAILRKMTQKIETFELGRHDISFQFMLPNSVYGRHAEQQLISAAIAQAASAYRQCMNGDISEDFSDSDEDDDATASKKAAAKDADFYVFEDDIVSLKSQMSCKIPLTSKTLLRTPKPFDGIQSIQRGPEVTDPIVRVVFVSGPSGVGKTNLIRGMASVARNSGLFAAGVFEAEGRAPYSAILSCIQSVLQQLLAQHTDELASLVVAIQTAFEPSSGIGIVCDLVPELKYFFSVSEMPESRDVPLTHSVARFHALILKLIRVISTHFFMTWLIDDLQFADENSIDLIATLVNVNKRLPIVFIITHHDSLDCLIKVKHILGGGNVAGGQHPTGFGSLGTVHHDTLMDDVSTKGGGSSKTISKSAALRVIGLPRVVRGGGGVRFIRLQHPPISTLQDFLSALLHRDKTDVISLAKVLHGRSWLNIRQLVLELYRNRTIFFDCATKKWEWESCQETLAEIVRKLTGEEYAFLTGRFRDLDCNTKKALICASICGPSFTIRDLQLLMSAAYYWTGGQQCAMKDLPSDTDSDISAKRECNAMAGIQAAIQEGILVYTSVPDHLKFHHGIMRRVAVDLLDNKEEMETLHYEMINILSSRPGQEFRIANHVLQSMGLIKKKLAAGVRTSDSHADSAFLIETTQSVGNETEQEPSQSVTLDTCGLRAILSIAGEKAQKSGAQDMALAHWDAALSMLPANCWDQPPDTYDQENDVDMESTGLTLHSTASLDNHFDSRPNRYPLYHEALRLHLQCIEAERWRENFDQAMRICDTVLAKVSDPIDRALVYEHQIEMSVWAFSSPDQAASIALRCVHELGMSKDVDFNPSEKDLRTIFDDTHALLLRKLPFLEADPPERCTNPRIARMIEVLNITSSSLYYCNIPFMATALIEAVKLICEYGVTKDTGRALVSFALTYSTWYGCLDHVYELGRLACTVSNDSHHVKYLFYLAVQQWGDHIANAIPALEETLTAVDLTCDRLFHTSGMIHLSLTKVFLGRAHLNDLMTTTIELLAKHIEFGPKSHGIEVMQGILQLIKALKGQTLASDPETIFDDIDFSETKSHGRRDKKPVAMVHNNSTYQMLKVVAAFIFGHYNFVQDMTDSWHDDSKSIMNFEGSWIAHIVFTVVGLTLSNLLRTETDPAIRRKHTTRLFRIREQMELRANKFPTNHAAMYYLLEAEIADQGLTLNDSTNNSGSGEAGAGIKALLMYEKAIKYSIDGDFPLHQCIAYEMTSGCHLRHGLVTSARCLMIAAAKGYQAWGAKGKVQWFHRTYPKMFPVPEEDPTTNKRGLFYTPEDDENCTLSCPRASTVGAAASVGGVSATSPWMTGSPKVMSSPTMFRGDAFSAAAAAMADFNVSSSLQSGYPSTTSTSSPTSSTPLYSLQNTQNPQSPEPGNTDLDVLDFSSVIEAMQVIASEIDLGPLLVKSLGVLNQSVGAKQCSVIISREQELVLAASLGERGRCESVDPPVGVDKCGSLFHGIINYVVNTSTSCLLTNAKDDPRFCEDEYLKQRSDLRTVLCAPILHKATLVGVLYMEDFPERAFANKRLLVMNLLVQQLGISITNALLYQSVLQSETKLNGLLENMPCGIALWDSTAETCVYINSSWKDMTGFSGEEIINSRWQVLLHPDEMVMHGIAWKKRVQEGEACQWECRYGLKDGSFRWAVVRMLPIRDARDNNKILQWLTVTTDIDDQRRAVQLKSNFLANMSHELRTPFSGILGMLSLLRDSSGLSHEQFEFVDMAKASCEMLIRIVDDLLNFSKLEADKVTLEDIPLCFEEIIGDVCDLLVPLASRKGLELIILVDDTLPVQLIGDPDRIKQILMNLIGNAIKFSTSGSVIVKYWHTLRKRETIKSTTPSQSVLDILAGRCAIDFFDQTRMEKLRTQAMIEMDNSQLGDEVELHCSVTDQGIGMTPDEQKMLFVSFQQTDNGTTRKYGGTGLGLSICSQLISHMNGKIVVESEKGKGSTFTFSAKIRTMTDHDKEQNPVEYGRIMECQKVMAERWGALENKRLLILSPNGFLREQIVRASRLSDCMAFDSVASAVQAGAIGILSDSLDRFSGISRDPTTPGVNNEDPMEGLLGIDGQIKPASRQALEGIRPFDFILVDHVLDSAELDSIYPSPNVAFVLLLAPTNETLRWILPPAQKHVDHDSYETDSGQIDIGGRGRFLKSADKDFTEKALGQVRSASYLSRIKAQSRPRPTESPDAVKKMPSQLFQLRKRSIQATTIKKRKGHGSVEAGDDSISGATEKASSGRSSIQVCRMIKPVRRLKVLQIMYNALMRHEQSLDEEDTVYSGHLVEISDGETDMESAEDEEREQRSRSRPSPSSDEQSSMTLSRSVSPDGSESPQQLQQHILKRKRSKGLRDVMTSERDDISTTSEGSDKDGHVRKAYKTDSSRSSSSSSLARTGSVNNDPPRRARNNDALTLLLTQEERKKCEGVNVLVAEDDFVSQKILEKQLSKLGMNVKIANNGQEAVDEWLAAERGHYTIAIFDHHMPIMDGLAATKKLRALEAQFAEEQSESGSDTGSAGDEQSKIHARLPIVGLSADIQLATKEKCIKGGMDEYMTKPLLTQGLALLIQRYCCS